MLATGLLLISMLSSVGCTMITQETPCADISKLGVVLNPGESITIGSTNGIATVKYAAPTKRYIIWNGQSREISLRKSSPINGIYRERVKFREGAIGDVYGAGYQETTTVFSSDEEYQDFLQYICPAKFGWEHRKNSQMFVRLDVRQRGSKKYLYIWISKYRFQNGNGVSPIIH
jgi:hypothetical protein